jgi:hypothetical protein
LGPAYPYRAVAGRPPVTGLCRHRRLQSSPYPSLTARQRSESLGDAPGAHLVAVSDPGEYQASRLCSKLVSLLVLCGGRQGDTAGEVPGPFAHCGVPSAEGAELLTRGGDIARPNRQYGCGVGAAQVSGLLAGASSGEVQCAAFRGSRSWALSARRGRARSPRAARSPRRSSSTV